MLAQMVEQRTFNPFVVGSIPAHPTNKINDLHIETIATDCVAKCLRCQSVATFLLIARSGSDWGVAAAPHAIITQQVTNGPVLLRQNPCSRSLISRHKLSV